MDDFFNAVASLMSDLLRRCIQRSLNDLIAMMELYKEGNNYEGDYHILRGLAVTKLKQPSTIFLVCERDFKRSLSFSFVLQF